jgi:multiple sugar transport system substrate-binding protein
MNAHEYTFAGKLKQTAPDLKFSVHMPPHAAGQPKATGGTHGALVVSSKSKNQEAAWQWIKFLTSEQSQRKWIAQGGELPSLKSLYDDASLRSDPVVAAGLDSMQYTKPFNDYGWDDVYTIQQAIWDNVVLKGTAVEAAGKYAAQAEEKLYADKKIAPSQ